MKKILVLSYFFPPCSLTASNRVLGIVSKLHKFGIYPIVVTRNWNENNDTPEDLLSSIGGTLKHTIHEGYEVYQLPYKSGFRDNLIIKSKKNKFYSYISKIFTMINILAEPFSNKFIPFSNIYDFSFDLISKNHEIKHVLISANPFIQFKFGYLLSKKTGVSWSADYRDSWTTNKFAASIRRSNKIVLFYQRFFELKWVKTASFFTSVSENYVNQIYDLVGIPGELIYNGYLNKKYYSEFSNEESLNVFYSGTLYYNQPIEFFLNFLKNNNFKIAGVRINLHFAGLGFDTIQKQRVLDHTYDFRDNIYIYDWLTKDEYNQLLKGADLLLMLPYLGFKGIPSSKLFDYLSTGKNILLYQTDNDVIEYILRDSCAGYVSTSDTDLYKYLISLIEAKNNKCNFLNKRMLNVDTYSFESQVKKLALILNSNI